MIFIAAPYTHGNPAVVQARVDNVRRYFIHLAKQGIHATGTLLMSHEVVKLGFTADHDFWSPYSREILDKCEAMHVLCLPGAGQSLGLKDEIKYCYSNDIRVDYISPNSFTVGSMELLNFLPSKEEQLQELIQMQSAFIKEFSMHDPSCCLLQTLKSGSTPRCDCGFIGHERQLKQKKEELNLT